jgi:hypothetical protein
LHAASDADAARWVERAEWNSHPPRLPAVVGRTLRLDPVTLRVIEMGWQRAQTLDAERRESL